MEHGTHLNWIAGLVLIVVIICATLIWLNYNSWTLLFEMDENTKEAIESIEFDKLKKPRFGGKHKDNLLTQEDIDIRERFKIEITKINRGD